MTSAMTKRCRSKISKRKSIALNALSALYQQPLPATRTGPLYNAFSYPTKISPEAIALFVATHTEPGATLLDSFAGSGTAGIAALLCDKPTPAMEQMADQLGLKPKWGPRQAVLYELGVLGSFVSRTMCSPLDPEHFESVANELIDQVEREYGWLWDTIDPKGRDGKFRHAIWTDVLTCAHCGTETPFWRAAVRRKPLRLVSTFVCPGCRKRVSIDRAERAVETVFDPILNKSITRKKRALARIYGQTDGKNWCRDAVDTDMEMVERAAAVVPPSTAPTAEIVWGDLHRAGYHKGITHLHHFYTARNFLAVAALWAATEKFPESVRDALKLLVLSYNATHSTLMTRVVIKDGQGDFILTGAQSGVLYVSGLPVEKNVFQGVRRKIRTFKQSFELISGSRSRVDVVNASSTKLHLPDDSVDYIFTDPPFGDYIPYAELNQLNEAWLGKVTERKDEIIISSAQGKDVSAYGKLMTDVFREMARVLKHAGAATVVFHSAKAAVWHALMEAYGAAGFRVQATSVLDKLQVSFKQVVSNVSVKGDPLLLLVKKDENVAEIQTGVFGDTIFREILLRARKERDPRETEPSRLYSRFVSRCLELGVEVSFNADEFYHHVRITEIAA